MRRSFKGYSYRKYKKVRYSNETSTFTIEHQIQPQATAYFPNVGNPATLGKTLVDAAQIQGTRKVKNLALSISSTNPCEVPILCAVVYVPQGTSPSQLNLNAANQKEPNSLYEPNQNVIMQFVLNPVYNAGQGTNVQRFKTRLARNLDSGDRIMLICAPAYASANAQTVKIAGTLNYAISF